MSLKLFIKYQYNKKIQILRLAIQMECILLYLEFKFRLLLIINKINRSNLNYKELK